MWTRKERNDRKIWLKEQILSANNVNSIISQDELIIRCAANFSDPLNNDDYDEAIKNLIGEACKELRDEIPGDDNDPWRIRANTITVIGSSNTLMRHEAYREFAEAQCIVKPTKLAKAFGDNADSVKRAQFNVDTNPTIYQKIKGKLLGT